MDDMQTVNLIGKLMDVGALRHKVIAHNIANVNTPGFKKSEVQFESALQKAMAKGHIDSAQRISPMVVLSRAAPLRNDGNNVDVDKEIGQLGKNTLLFNTYSSILSRKFKMLKSAATGQNH